MSIVNFSVPKILDRKIKRVVSKKGFSSKAEFFRFAAIRYLDETEKRPLEGNRRIVALTSELEKELVTKIGSKPLPSIKKQLARMQNL